MVWLSQPKTTVDSTRASLNTRQKLGWLAIVVAAVVGLGFALWETVLEDRLIAKRFGVVVPGEVFRSGQISKWMLKPTLKKHGIQVIIDLNGVEIDDPHQAAEIDFINRTHFEHYRYRLSGDGIGDIRNYALALKTIQDCRAAHKPVLVHCSAGSQRTGGVVAMFRVLIQKQSSASAVAELENYDWTPGKDQVLLDYLNSHMAELAGLLVEMKVIDKVPDPLPVFHPPE